MALDYISSTVDAALLANPVTSVPVLYSRPGNSQLDPVAAFAVPAIINTSGEFASPTGPIYADVFLQTSAIPLGPQKGDLIAINDSAVQDGTYLVQEIFWDRRAGSAHLKVRWTGQ